MTSLYRSAAGSAFPSSGISDRQVNRLVAIKLNRQFQIVLESELQSEFSVVVAGGTRDGAVAVQQGDANAARGMTRPGAIKHLANDRSPIRIAFPPDLQIHKNRADTKQQLARSNDRISKSVSGRLLLAIE